MEIELFMRSYMFELENELKQNLDFFNDVTYYFDEANSDKEIKVKIKEFILTKMTNLREIVSIISEDGTENVINKNNFEIINVKVTDELSHEDKDFIKKTRTAVYTNPDLLFFIKNGDLVNRVSVEIKTTLNDKIPGSSIQQIDESDWVIFIKHNGTRIIDLTTGKYMNSISGTIQFPDRSPRPQVSYNNLKAWNEKFRKNSKTTISYLKDDDYIERKKILDDWQLLLSERWLKVLGNNRKPKGEPWFNNNIRKYSLILLNYYENLTKDEKEEFKLFVEKNIKDGDDVE